MVEWTKHAGVFVQMFSALRSTTDASMQSFDLLQTKYSKSFSTIESSFIKLKLIKSHLVYILLKETDLPEDWLDDSTEFTIVEMD